MRRAKQKAAERKMLKRERDYPKCPCGKVAYPNEWEAGRVVVKGNGEARVYFCEPGACWHTTSKAYHSPPRAIR